MQNWDGKERRDYVLLDTDQIEKMLDVAAERGADRALAKIYAEVGQSIVKRTFLVVGALLAALLAWVNSAITIGIATPK